MSAVAIVIETVTPDVAAAYMASNTGNRPLRNHRVRVYAAAMTAGEWMLTGDPIVFDSDERLIQGQHRLAACIASGVPFTTAVMRHADPATYAVMDSGLGRKAGDVLTHSGIPNANVAAAAARLVIGYETGTIHDSNNLAITSNRAAILAHVTERRDEYASAVKHANNVMRRTRLLSSSTAAFIVIVGPPAAEFVQRVADGVGLDENSPELALRSWAVNAMRMTNQDHLSALIRAWNASAQGQPLKLIKRWQRGTPFPRVIALTHERVTS